MTSMIYKRLIPDLHTGSYNPLLTESMVEFLNVRSIFGQTSPPICGVRHVVFPANEGIYILFSEPPTTSVLPTGAILD